MNERSLEPFPLKLSLPEISSSKGIFNHLTRLLKLGKL